MDSCSVWWKTSPVSKAFRSTCLHPARGEKGRSLPTMVILCGVNTPPTAFQFRECCTAHPGGHRSHAVPRHTHRSQPDTSWFLPCSVSPPSYSSDRRSRRSYHVPFVLVFGAAMPGKSPRSSLAAPRWWTTSRIRAPWYWSSPAATSEHTR